MKWYVYKFFVKCLNYKETRTISGKSIIEALLKANYNLSEEFGVQDIDISYIREL